jgi:hypothetical protein
MLLPPSMEKPARLRPKMVDLGFDHQPLLSGVLQPDAMSALAWFETPNDATDIDRYVLLHSLHE